MTRSEARSSGQVRYVGHPCGRCGEAVRYVASNSCAKCAHRTAAAVSQKARADRVRRLAARYGVDEVWFEDTWRRQGGACAICLSALRRGAAGHAVDHDHATGRVRGLLCSSCNNGLGRFRDNPEALRAAAAYLEQHRGSE